VGITNISNTEAVVGSILICFLFPRSARSIQTPGEAMVHDECPDSFEKKVTMWEGTGPAVL